MNAEKEQAQVGDLADCQSCGNEIEYIGSYWRHTGTQYRHPAQPISGTIHGPSPVSHTQKIPPLDTLLARYPVQSWHPPFQEVRMSRHKELLHLWRDLGYTRIAEIGTEMGRYAEEICRAIPGVHLTCIDPWQAYDRYADHVDQTRLDHFYHVAQERLAKYPNVTLMRAASLEAVQHFDPGTLDVVFIDGNHHFDYVVRDIIAWAPIVRSGGMVAGHDYKPEGQERVPIPFGVIPAVNGYVEAHKISPVYILRGDKCPSFAWIVP
jgi:predicted O-methyltransferase YrrM